MTTRTRAACGHGLPMVAGICVACENERLVEALRRYDDAIALCAAIGPTTEEWETIKDAYLYSPIRKSK